MVHSLITLFAPNESVFTTNGLGSLGEAISCVVTEERNGSFELEMVYPISGKHYKDIQLRSIILAKPNPVDNAQLFRIYKITKPMDGQVTYYAAHISYDLDGYLVQPFVASTRARAMSLIRGYMVGTNGFEFHADAGGNPDGYFKVETPTSIRSILGGSEGSILETFGGEYKFDNLDVDLLNNRGMDRGVVIRYGKNLTDLKQEESMSDVYTDILPYWYGEVKENEDVEGTNELITLPELTIKCKTEYNFQRILPLDLSSSFQEKPFFVDLRDAANKWLEENDPSVPSVSFDISFVQLEQTEEYKDLALLERVELCDEVTVEYPDFGISVLAKVITTVYDVIAQKYTSITLGDARPSLSNTIIGQGEDLDGTAEYLKDAFGHGLDSLGNSFTGKLDGLRKELSDSFDESLKNVKTEFEKATEEATEWITNGRGYMVAVKNEVGQWMEICSLDNPDIDQAIQVWRWNNGGFGHSSHGYDGPYEVAITQDGKINAKFVVTGEMSANRIRGGLLLLGGENNGNGTLNTQDARGNDVCTITENGLEVSKGVIRGTSIVVDKSDDDYDYETKISIENSSIRFYEGRYTDPNVQDPYSGQIVPSPEQGAYWNGDDFVEYAETYPGLSIDAAYLFKIKVGGITDMVFRTSAVEVPQSLYITQGGLWSTRDLTTTQGVTAKTGQFSDSLTVAGLPVTGSILISSSGLNDKPITTVATSYSYSLTSPMKGDIGSGETDENGICYVYLDDYANSAMNTSIEYYVFLQKEGPGDIWIKEKNEQYFIVEGTPNLKFSWELKGKQTGYEYERMEDQNALTPDYEDPGDEIINENLKDIYSTIADREQDQIKEIEEAIKDREEAFV